MLSSTDITSKSINMVPGHIPDRQRSSSSQRPDLAADNWSVSANALPDTAISDRPIRLHPRLPQKTPPDDSSEKASGVTMNLAGCGKNRTTHDILEQSHNFKSKEENQKILYENEPDFSSNAMRLSTYKKWKYCTSPLPSCLSEAGFYYTGKDDLVICFSCKGKIKDWEANDSALEVHKHYFPKCQFIQQKNTASQVKVPKRNQDLDLSIELNRLSTFTNWPVTSQKITISLARAGFFYTGQDDLVECFSCKGKMKDWEPGDSAKGLHKTHFPSCKFISKISPKDKTEAQKKTPLTNPSKPVTSQLEKEDSGSQQSNKKLNSEYCRLLTFTNWSSISASPRLLSKAGFYYIRGKDTVKCFACDGEISNWKKEDIPMTQHTCLFPDCSFVLGKNVGNVELTVTGVMNYQHAAVYKEPTSFLPPKKNEPEKSQPTQTAKVVDQASLFQNQRMRRPLTRTRHPQFGSIDKRTNTFKHWPDKKTKPEVPFLAKAGFFYIGVGDSIKCFYCDGGLKAWGQGDDPWIEHAKWFPKCEWLIQQRGESFVQKIQLSTPQARSLPQNPEPRKEREKNQGTAQPSIIKNPQDQQFPENKLDLTEVQKIMNSLIVKSVIEMGFPIKKIKRIIEQQLIKKEKEFKSIQSLVDILFVEPDEESDFEEEKKFATAQKLSANPPPASMQPNKNAESDSEIVIFPAKNEQLQNEQLQEIEDQPETEKQAAPEDELSLPPAIQNELRELRDKAICKICMDIEINTLFTPCGHLVSCEKCSCSIRLCPICRIPIKTVIKIFLS